MADDVLLPPTGTGTANVTVAADDRSGVHVQRIEPVGTTTNVAAQVTVTNTSTTIVSSRAMRHRLILVNYQTVPVYIDPSGGSATTSMFRMDPGSALELHVTSAVTGITSAAYTAVGDAKVHVIEEYD